MDRWKPRPINPLRAVLTAATPLLLAYALLSWLGIPRVVDIGFRPARFSVTDVRKGGPADRAGLRAGDRIVSLNGIPTGEGVRIFREFSRIRPGDTILYTVERDGEKIEITEIAGTRGREFRTWVTLRTITAACFFLLALIVFWNRHDRVATLFYLSSLSFGFLLLDPPPTASVRLQFLIKVSVDLAVLFAPPLFLRLFLIFPREKRIPRSLFLLRPLRLPGIGRLRFPLYAVSTVLFTASLAMNTALFFTGRFHPAVILAVQFACAIYLLFCVLAGIGAFLHSYTTTRSVEMKRKLRGVVWGTTAALLPIAFVNVLKLARPGTEIVGGPYFILLAVLLPLSFGHAIIRYGLLDIELIIKRSILYTLLTAFLAMAYITVVALAGRFVRAAGGRTDLPATFLSLFLIALLFSPVRNLIQGWVDRTFYREKFHYRTTLHQFSRAITSILDLGTLVEVLVQRISTTLHVPEVAVFLFADSDGAHTLQAETGLDALDSDEIRFHADDRIVRHLEFHREALPVEKISDGEGTLLLPEKERFNLTRLNSALLVPLFSGKRLSGIVSLGRKQSGGYYSGEDRQLLNTLANQATLAIENAKLHRDTVEKERMKQQLHLAREIQLQFLPEAPPALPEIDVAALNISSEVVGGDFYDYVVGENDTLGVVIGDAVGHGVSAALLMASLQAAFHAEARCEKSPAATLREINAQLYTRTHPGGRFLTAFYGVLHRKSGLFRYANAGHNPPVVIRSDGRAETLPGGDLILGVNEDVPYEEFDTVIAPGEILLLFTDGLTDEPNHRDESFGVDRLTRLVRGNRESSCSMISNAVYREAIRFFGEAPNDDVTLVVVKKT